MQGELHSKEKSLEYMKRWIEDCEQEVSKMRIDKNSLTAELK